MQQPVVAYLVLDDTPHLVANACTACGAVFFDRRNACAQCSKTSFEPRTLATTGRVRSFTVIHRAPAGTKTPFTSVVVELDGGGVVDANLLDSTDPAEIAPDLPVRLVTFVAGTDDAGVDAVAFGFEKAS